jgi:triacylglycerol lipase
MKVDWKTQTFNGANAEVLGKAASLAYADEATVATKVKDWKMELIHSFNLKETQAYIIGDNETWILAFRGTEPNKIKDWITDLDAKHVGGPGGKVHEGFLVALSYVWSDIWNTLKDERGFRSLWVTGHSLGGALATLAVAKLRQERGHPVNGLYTFGQPRVGDEEFSSHFNQDFGPYTYRFINNNDVVPRVPTRLMNYRDTGIVKYFNEYGKINDKITWDQILLRRIGERIEDILALDDIKDHSMINYLNNLAWLANPKLPKAR